ncbi:unannotated protein [freshwater metagenome]|uniref:Unannotated protein n=1 Tax=freshwater metagenome TaxID=449393 RepID=A0A6J7NW00_9ZZZZ|nr:hypothetical protein [Actinomycetota bacterium]MSV85850.1 hypothetical protein [Actinomycetota bacterium]
MALLPTLLAIGIGVGLGLYWGGSLENMMTWRPLYWQALLGGIGVSLLLDLFGIGGFFGALLLILATAAILGFAIVNLRTGGMVLVVAGLGLNLFVTLINWATPVSGSALVSAGILTSKQLPEVTLTGGRELADGALFGFLGDVIPLPWGHVISIGDVLILVGITLVTASVLRQYQVGGGSPRSGMRSAPNDYRSALDALGRGPAPRRGPGLHPSRRVVPPESKLVKRPGSDPR